MKKSKIDTLFQAAWIPHNVSHPRKFNPRDPQGSLYEDGLLRG